MMVATSDGTTLMTKDNKKQQKPQTLSEARKANMSRVLLANYWEWVKQGRPLRT